MSSPFFRLGRPAVASDGLVSSHLIDIIPCGPSAVKYHADDALAAQLICLYLFLSWIMLQACRGPTGTFMHEGTWGAPGGGDPRDARPPHASG